MKVTKENIEKKGCIEHMVCVIMAKNLSGDFVADLSDLCHVVENLAHDAPVKLERM